jgi:hypothetical protein
MRERYPNGHHILFNRAAWESNANTKWLREETGLIVRMDYDTHNELHRNIAVVPLLDHYTASRVRSMMRGCDATKPLDIADDFMSAVQEAGRHYRAKPLDRALGELVILAVESQREYIEAGIVKAQVFDIGHQRRRYIPHDDHVLIRQSA